MVWVKGEKKHDADELAERMMDMASEGMVENKITRNESAFNRQKRNKFSGSDWQTIIHRDDGSGLALKALKRVQKGWGQGSISSLQPQKNDFLDYWEGTN